MVDQQSASMMSCAGNRDLHTPYMDSIAARGVRFDRAYCTNPLCIPSRFSLLTGRRPSEIGLWSNRTSHLPPLAAQFEGRALGHLLQQAGYLTAYAGKVHLPRMKAEDIGFEVISADEREAMAEDCAAFLQRRHNQPFCLFASFINPHDICMMALCDFATTDHEKLLVDICRTEQKTLDVVLQRPEDVDEGTFISQYCPPLPPNYEPQEDEPEAIRLMLEARPFRAAARERWNASRWREHRWAYARLTEKVDSEIGIVLESLRASPYADNTVVIFTSDHGELDAAYRMEHKSTHYEPACRIPLIIDAPGVANPGAVAQELVSNGLDLMPTICDYAGAAVPPELSGRSLRPLVEGREIGEWRTALPLENACGRAIVTQNFKYFQADIGQSAEQLYDRQTDPWEKRNALQDPALAAELSDLRHLHKQLFQTPVRDEATVLADLESS